jgi:hypothetical protein
LYLFIFLEQGQVCPNKHYSEYYDDELREMIAEKDKLLIDRFGYGFEDGDTR